MAAVALGTTGPLVVFLPGLGGTAEYWRPLADSVASDARVLLVDPLGFGASAKPGGQYSMARHVAALEATLRGGPAAILVGHSFGARLAIAYAARHPARVRALVLYGLAFYGDPIATRAFFQSGAVPRRWIFADESSTALACLVSRRLLGPMLPMFAPDLPPRVVKAASTHTWRSSSSTFWSTIMEYDLGPDIDALPARLPVHLVHGAQDRTAPLDSVRALAARHPDWTLLVLPTAGHHAWWTAPDAARGVLDTAIAPGRGAGDPGARD
ncbi:MAG: alpha/beta hydrolase [Gemmatimonadetes bacterium]|nr:alpha/beta hydrolase [Gemmatimonadota bacterium]